MNLLLGLSSHGAIVFVLVWAFDAALGRRMRTAGRAWWWLAVPLAFLVPNPLSLVLRQAPPPMPAPEFVALEPVLFTPPPAADPAWQAPVTSHSPWLWFWLAGTAGWLGVVLVQTRAVYLKWGGARLSTDAALLGLLEDCKQEAGITAPIGVVIAGDVSAPAILGWLRPRILLPAEAAATLPPAELRAVLLHELAHFRSYDIPVQWLFTAVSAVHWFNPFAHLAFRAWAQFREEAADEMAITWMRAPSSLPYGEALMHVIRQANGGPAPFGALAIGESLSNLKHRLTMINQYTRKSPRLILAGAILAVVVSTGFLVRPVLAADATDAKSVASGAMEKWLTEIDASKYAESWTDAAASFQKALTSDQWVAALKSVRTPLGKCKSREVASAVEQAEVPGSAGAIKGDFIIAQFNSSFDNLAYAVETVTFEKGADGSWKASGYFIKPKL
jgi:beta-lactamase regulating signal transducer with metallopeptidase domain